MISPPRRNKGFTLLEVMVALAIFSVAALTLQNQISTSVRNADRLKTKTLATWLAQNKMAELRVQGEWPSTGSFEDEVEMAGRTWLLTSKVVTTQSQAMRRIEVSVSDNANKEHTLGSLIGFLGEH